MDLVSRWVNIGTNDRVGVERRSDYLLIMSTKIAREERGVGLKGGPNLTPSNNRMKAATLKLGGRLRVSKVAKEALRYTLAMDRV